MTIQTTQATYSSHISENSLKEILEFYWKHHLKQDIIISNVTHATSNITRGFGMSEMDITEANGLTINFKDKQV